MMTNETISIHPPACVLGVIGGGQLGRMLIMAARQMGVRTVVWTGGLEAPAAELANEVIDLPFDDAGALVSFCEAATVATVEFENIPGETLRGVAAKIPLHPSPEVVTTCQNRRREKEFLLKNGIPCAKFALVSTAHELAAAMAEIAGPWVLKTADFGYDGSGQLKIAVGDDAVVAWNQFGAPCGVLEEWVPFEKELSVMIARGADGVCAVYDPAENHHRDHILDWSVVPARLAPEVIRDAEAIAIRVAEALDYRGIMGVEFFAKSDGSLVVNEMAPRPHNSGHHTMDACVTSQFEQQLRAVIGLPLGSTRLLSPVVMLNLLGGLWPGETEPPDWTPLFADGEGHLHLYGKAKASKRRKMGHANFLGEDALERALAMQAGWISVVELGNH